MFKNAWKGVAHLWHEWGGGGRVRGLSRVGRVLQHKHASSIKTENGQDKKYNRHNKNSTITQLRMGQGDTIFNHCQDLKLMMIFVKNQSYQLRHKEKVTKLTHWLILIGQNTRDMMTSQEGEDDTGLGIRKWNLTGKNPGGMPPPPGGIPSWWGIWPKLFGGAEFWKEKKRTWNIIGKILLRLDCFSWEQETYFKNSFFLLKLQKFSLVNEEVIKFQPLQQPLEYSERKIAFLWATSKS